MLGKVLYSGKDWEADGDARVFPPDNDSIFWLIDVNCVDGYKLEIMASEAVIISKNNRIEEIHY